MLKLKRREITPVLVSNKDGKLKTDSLIVAKVFEKRHDDVLKAIRNLESDSDFKESNFRLDSYKDVKGEVRSCYELTQAGFLFLVTSFAGRKAAKFRELYFTEGFEAACNWICEESINKTVKLDQLYVVLYQDGTVKVGKGRSAKARIETHSHHARIHNNLVVDYDIELEPKISEQQLIDFCIKYGDHVGGREYFSDVKFKDVVRFMKLQKLPRHQINTILPYRERRMQCNEDA